MTIQENSSLHVESKSYVYVHHSFHREYRKDFPDHRATSRYHQFKEMGNVLKGI